MKISFSFLMVMLVNVCLIGSSMANLEDAQKLKQKSKQQRDQAQQNVKKRQDQEKEKKENEKKMKELQNKMEKQRKMNETMSNIIKSDHDTKKGVIGNIR